ncbi:MAG: hypothetical protein AAF572_23915 [Cyanobacteria bacterium P01_B01_bin.77]
MWKSKKWLSWILPGLVLILGVGLSLKLQIYSRNGVFFSTDAGLKALLTQQLSTGQWQIALDIPRPPWVLTLWRQGLYPFAPPYAYEQQGNYFITFPFTFSALTAPFYALMGYSGLYVVPLVSLWVIWGRFWHVCQVWRLRSRITALSLGLIILASPLTLYGAMYWEHTLAVALAFWGLSGLMLHSLSKNSSERISLNEAMVNGVCVGLSVWFRPEFSCLVAILGTMIGLSLAPPKRLPGWLRVQIPRGLSRTVVIAFAGAMVATVLGLFGTNWVFYGHLVGIRAIQLGTESSLSWGQRVGQIGNNYGQMVVSLLRYFPAVLLGLGLPWWLRGRARRLGIMLGLVGGLFAIAVPLIASSAVSTQQWGPRFYLILVPMVGLVVAAGLQNLWRFKQKRQYALAAISLVCVVGFYANIINGGLLVYRDPLTNSASLPSNYAPIAPAITALANYDERWVAMPHQHVAQQLWPSVQLKTFFRTETNDAIERLAAALISQNEPSFLYICNPEKPCPAPEQGALRFQMPDGNGGNTRIRVSFESLGTFGQYPFYRGAIQTSSAGPQA